MMQHRAEMDGIGMDDKGSKAASKETLPCLDVGSPVVEPASLQRQLSLAIGVLRLAIDEVTLQAADSGIAETDKAVLGSLASRLHGLASSNPRSRRTSAAPRKPIALTMGAEPLIPVELPVPRSCTPTYRCATPVMRTRSGDKEPVMDSTARHIMNTTALPDSDPKREGSSPHTGTNPMAFANASPKKTQSFTSKKTRFFSSKSLTFFNKKQNTLVSLGAAHSEINAQRMRQQLIDVFMELDMDADGFVTVEELETCLRKAGQSPEVAHVLVEEADSDEDGRINQEEWVKMVQAGNSDSLVWQMVASALSDWRPKEDHSPGQASRCMLRQGSLARITWDMLVMAVLTFLAVSTPYSFAFSTPGDEAFAEVAEYAIVWFFCLDIVLNFRTGYVSPEGIEILEQRRVAMRYLRTWFVVDVVSTVPWDFMMSGLPISGQPVKLIKGGKLAKVFKLLKFGRLLKFGGDSEIADQLEEWMARTNSQTTMSLAMILIAMSLLCHWLACFIAAVDGAMLDTYTIGSGAYSEYITAVYWAVSTITTVGYGDVTPETDTERGCAMLAMVIGGSFYGYVIGNMTSLISAIGASRRKVNSQMEDVRVWLDHYGFPRPIRRRIRRYFMKALNQKPAPDELAIINELSPDLRNAVSDYLIPEKIRRNYVFRGIPNGAMTRILGLQRIVHAEADETVAKEGDAGIAMFVIAVGKAFQNCQGKHDIPESTTFLSEGDSFGEEILVGFEERYLYTVKAVSPLEMYMLTRTTFIASFEALPEALRKMRLNVAAHLKVENNSSKWSWLPGSTPPMNGEGTSLERTYEQLLEKMEDLREKVGTVRLDLACLHQTVDGKLVASLANVATGQASPAGATQVRDVAALDKGQSSSDVPGDEAVHAAPIPSECGSASPMKVCIPRRPNVRGSEGADRAWLL